jgi:Lrp/AsnC family transcriptional regulator for asnA, asnC and gidA
MDEKQYSLAAVTGRIYKKSTYLKVLPTNQEKKGDNDKLNLDIKKLDKVDLGIIKLLVNDSRTTLSTIADELGIGTSTVYKRISRLVNKGVIRRFTILADGEKLGLGAAAYMGINCSKNSKEIVKEELLDIKEIVEIHEVLEPYDFLIKVKSSDIKTLKEGPLNLLSELEGIEEVKSILVVNTVKEAFYNL